MSIEFLVNIVVICLLIPTIIFAVILNKRLEILRKSRSDLARLIDAFNEATTRAEAGIPRLKQAADSTGTLLKEQIQKAQVLRDDIAFMVERADVAASNLEHSLKHSSVSTHTPFRSDIQESQRKAEDMDLKSILNPALNAARNAAMHPTFNAEMEPNPSSDSVSSMGPKSKRKRVLAEKPEDIISSAVLAAEDILRGEEEQRFSNTPNFGSSSNSKRQPLSLGLQEEPLSDRSEAEKELLKALQSMR